MIRPELRAALRPWREALIGGALALFGLYWAWTGIGILRWIGFAVVVAGAAIALSGIRRARFPRAGDGPGVVDVDERQITYFGPDGGAAISIDAVVRVEFDTRHGRAWVFHADGTAPLRVPSDAAGADKLFDALAPLPGFDYDAAIRAARSDAPPQTLRSNVRSLTIRSDAQHLFVIWQRDRTRLH